MRFLTSVLAAVMLALPVGAQQDEIKGVITSQLQSFLKDDFVTAFTFAAPNIKQMFGTPERFAQMVTQGYPMVHRPAEVQFQGLSQEEDTYRQEVLLRDVQGQYFVAEYTMVMIDGKWQISGVSIVRSPGVGA